jgi:hypothetical protein
VLVCETPTLERWRPDFSSSEQRDPQWVRVVCDGVELTNAVDWVDWLTDGPVQVVLCEACGANHCASGGYAHVSRLGTHLLWTLPRIDWTDPFESSEYGTSYALEQRGAVAIPFSVWDEWRQQFPDIPDADAFPRTRRSDLYHAWTDGTGLIYRVAPAAEFLTAVREHAVASDPSDLAALVAAVEQLTSWFAADPEAPVDGRLAEPSDRVVVETLYFDLPDTFDRPRLHEWQAVCRSGGNLSPVLGGLVIDPVVA